MQHRFSTRFPASEVTPVYGVTPALFYPIRSQYLCNLLKPIFVARQVWMRVVKRASPFNSFCSKWSNSCVWRDSRVIYPIRSQYLRNLLKPTIVARHVWMRVVKRATSLFNSFCSKWSNSCVWRDSRVILSNQKSVFTQLAETFICCKTGLNEGGKTRNIAFQLVFQQVK